MPKLILNGKEIEFDNGMTILQVCEKEGVEIPRFCYHDRLEIAGNCRMCLVEVAPGPPKPAASCAMPAGEGMDIKTNSEMVKKAREGVMEFLLINHPLDCPICDQGGECDLQDQAMSYGRGGNRYNENKRSVKDKPMGPLIKTQMTRCIHCTRCIRFLDDVAGVSDMGGMWRGEEMEVGTFIEKSISSELSGNIIDLCPVGALTSKPYAFKARSWELEHTESIDVHDAVGSNIRIDSRGNEVMRILPRLNEDVNEEWLSDKSRFACDGLRLQRLDKPMVRKNGQLVPATWKEAYSAIAKELKNPRPHAIAAIVGAMADAESILALKDLMTRLGTKNIDCRTDGMKIDSSERSSYLFNTTIAGIEDADACLIIGSNPRYEASLVNTRIKKRSLAGGFPIGVVGVENNLTYKYEYLGDSPDILEELASGKGDFAKALKNAEKPMIIVGSGAVGRGDGEAILNIIGKICKKYGVVRKDWNGFNILHTVASRVAALDLGFVPGNGGRDVEEIIAGVRHEVVDFIYLLGADNIETKYFDNSFIVYQGHHGDRGAHVADVILPGSAYTEKSGTYVNLEGRVQRTEAAIFPPGEAKEDWLIIKELSNHMGYKPRYESLSQIRDALVQANPVFANIGGIQTEKPGKFGKKGKILKQNFAETIDNFYMTDVICRASQTMAECSKEFVEKTEDMEKAA